MHTEGLGFLLVLVAIRLAVGLLPRPAVVPRDPPTWLPHLLATIVGALTARGVASGVLAPPPAPADQGEPDSNPDSGSVETSRGDQEPGDAGPPDRPPWPLHLGELSAPRVSSQSLAHPSARLG